MLKTLSLVQMALFVKTHQDMSLMFSDRHSRGAYLNTLRMAQFITPSPSFRSADAIDLRAEDDDPAPAHDDDIITENRMVIRKYI